MLKNYFTSFLVFLFISFSAFAQVAGDYRVKQDGDWDDLATWEVYNGTTWVNATDFPGYINASNELVIDDGTSVYFRKPPPPGANYTVNVNQDKLVITNGELVFENNADININVDRIELLRDGSGGQGNMRWVKNANVRLPEGTVVVINGGDLITSSNCNDSQSLYIGDDAITTCNGDSGSQGSFDDFVDKGGNRRIIITNRNKTYRVNKT